jgi:ankyrin repeat protein
MSKRKADDIWDQSAHEKKPKNENKISSTQFTLACEDGDLAIVKQGIEENINFNGIRSLSGRVPLHYACKEGRLLIVQELIRANAIIDIKDHGDATPLHLACQDGRLEIVRELIRANANVNIQDHDEMTPLYLACRENNLEIVQELIRANANVNIKNFVECTPLHTSCSQCFFDIVKALINANADVNAINGVGVTALHIAMDRGPGDIVRALIQADADVKCKTGRYDALSFGCRSGNLEGVAELIPYIPYKTIKEVPTIDYDKNIKSILEHELSKRKISHIQLTNMLFIRTKEFTSPLSLLPIDMLREITKALIAIA